MLCIAWHPSTVNMISTTIGRNTQRWSCWLSKFIFHIIHKNVAYIRFKLKDMRRHFLTKMVLWNNLHKFALSFHYCIVQQASSTAKATLTARLMSGKTSTFCKFLLETLQTYICVVDFQIQKVTPPCHFCVDCSFSFSPTPVASPKSPLL